MNKQQKRDISRLFGYASSHCNLSIAITAQDSFNIPVSARRTANIFVIWRQPDLASLSTMARRTGLKTKDFMSIFKNHITEDHDSLTIDLTRNSPAKLRINGYTILNSPDISQTVIIYSSASLAPTITTIIGDSSPELL